ncbi:hypothetical protein [Streptomyces sp. S.PNR 29]|uniref:hypothetical protein n=1 Tax=Streptomyces sp. S.PNR 29 TaxID=2973805 RepID=UPI0025B0D214|nr:hypothetical protein [Streptomyces sp. S.PNR 29]MDN0196862.1 hypothetical protein [Streptomyces sp. S.PNR 29]
MAAEHDGPCGVDALMAALTDEPLPPEAPENAAFLAERRSAAADVALLREQLGIIGRALGEAPEADLTHTRKPDEPAPVRAPRPRRRPFLAVAFGALAVACAGALVTGTGWLVARSGGGSDDSASSASAQQDSRGGAGLSAPGYVACARLIAEGDVTGVEPVPGTAQERITLEVTRSYKPAEGKDEVTFVMGQDVDPRLRTGDHVLVGIPRHGASPDMWTVGERDIARERAWILKALPESRSLSCE